jgi:hypothetical protein
LMHKVLGVSVLVFMWCGGSECWENSATGRLTMCEFDVLSGVTAYGEAEGKRAWMEENRGRRRGSLGILLVDVERRDGDLADKCRCCSQRDLFVDGAMTSVMPRKNTAAAPAGSASRAALPSARASTPPTSSSTAPPDGCTNKVNWRTPAAPQRTKVASSGRRLLPAWCRWITATPEKRDAVAASGSKTWTTASSDAVAARVHAEVPERDRSSRKGRGRWRRTPRTGRRVSQSPWVLGRGRVLRRGGRGRLPTAERRTCWV